jgi:hypothetical protein
VPGPEQIVDSVCELSDDELHNLAEVVRQVQIERAIANGDDVWVWESGLLLREDKRSSPGVHEGFRAVALVPLVDGTSIDVVSGRARSGQHSVDHVVSYEVRGGDLVEVSQRKVAAANMR